MDSLAGFLSDDAPGVGEVFEAIDKLPADPTPSAALAWTQHTYRLRVGRYRIVYDVADDLIDVRHVARVSDR